MSPILRQRIITPVILSLSFSTVKSVFAQQFLSNIEVTSMLSYLLCFIPNNLLMFHRQCFSNLKAPFIMLYSFFYCTILAVVITPDVYVYDNFSVQGKKTKVVGELLLLGKGTKVTIFPFWGGSRI